MEKIVNQMPRDHNVRNTVILEIHNVQLLGTNVIMIRVYAVSVIPGQMMIALLEVFHIRMVVELSIVSKYQNFHANHHHLQALVMEV